MMLEKRPDDIARLNIDVFYPYAHRIVHGEDFRSARPDQADTKIVRLVGVAHLLEGQ